MKKFLTTFIFPFLITVSMAQTQSNLPNGTKPYSSNIYLSPNADLWTGKPGLYMNIAKKRYVDSLFSVESTKPVSTVSLKINQSAPSGVFRVPVSTSNGVELQNGGLPVSENFNVSGYPTTIPLRSGGRILVDDAQTDFQAVNFRQLKSFANPLVGSTNSFIYNSPQSLISYSVDSRIDNLNGSNLTYQNLISNSFQGLIKGDTSYWNSLIGTQASTIGNKRRNSAIIASSASEIIGARVDDGFLKWNSAIIASYLSKIGETNSYTLVTGRGNQSNASAQFVCGRYNLIEPSISIDNPLRKAFIVGAGRGIDDNEGAIVRANAFEVFHGGRAWVQQELEVGAAGKGIVLKSPDGSRWSITINNSGVLTSTKLP